MLGLAALLTDFCPDLETPDERLKRMYLMREHGTAEANIEYARKLYETRKVESVLIKKADDLYAVYISIPDAIKLKQLPEGTV